MAAMRVFDGFFTWLRPCAVLYSSPFAGSCSAAHFPHRVNRQSREWPSSLLRVSSALC